jgi:hypothetical protein
MWQLRSLICVAANFLFPPVSGKQQQQQKAYPSFEFAPLKAGQRAVQAQLERFVLL